MMKPEEALTMEKLLNELQSVDTVKLVLTGCGESIYGSREVYEAIRPFVEKQVPKKPIPLVNPGGLDVELCSLCESEIQSNWVGCPYCLNKIDWGSEK